MERASYLLDDPTVAVGNRQIQISGPACVSLAVALLGRIAARDVRPVAWVLRGTAVPFPADLLDAGLRPERVLWLFADSEQRADRAADIILRSGQFSCIVYELEGAAPPEPGIASRFMHLCRRYRTTMAMIGTDRSVATVATTAVHLDTDLEYTPVRQSIRVTVRRSRRPLTDCEIPAYGPDHLY